MADVIYLKVAKVGSQNQDMTTSIERTTVTLEAGKNFNNFIKHLHVQNFLMSEADKPKVIKVIDVKNGVVGKEVDKAKYVEQVDAALEAMKNPNQEVDYKALAEKQAGKLSDMENRLAAFEDMLKKQSGGSNEDSESRKLLISKAKELDIKFRADISDDKLLEKIQAIEPEFKLKE